MSDLEVGFTGAVLEIGPWINKPLELVRLKPKRKKKELNQAATQLAKRIFPEDKDEVKAAHKAALSDPQDWPPEYRESVKWTKRYAALKGGQHVGISGLAALKSDPPDTVWFEWLGIPPELRGRRVGAELFDATWQKAIHLGFGKVRLWTTADHKEAIGMYTTRKFHMQHTSLLYDRNDEILIFSASLNDSKTVEPYTGVNNDVRPALYAISSHVGARLNS